MLSLPDVLTVRKKKTQVKKDWGKGGQKGKRIYTFLLPLKYNQISTVH